MKNKVLAATYNSVSNSKMFTVMVDIPYVLLPELLEYKELSISYKKIEEILDNSFAYTTCIISGTEWDNFLSLKLSENVQPEFREIVLLLKELYDNVDWKESKYHISFEEDSAGRALEYTIGTLAKENNFNITVAEEYFKLHNKWTSEFIEFQELCLKVNVQNKIKISASMCSNPLTEKTIEEHLKIADSFIKTKNYKAFQHQAIAMNENEYNEGFNKTLIVKKPNKNQQIIDSPSNKVFRVIEFGKCENLTGFISQKYIIENLNN